MPAGLAVAGDDEVRRVLRQRERVRANEHVLRAVRTKPRAVVVAEPAQRRVVVMHAAARLRLDRNGQGRRCASRDVVRGRVAILRAPDAGVRLGRIAVKPRVVVDIRDVGIRRGGTGILFDHRGHVVVVVVVPAQAKVFCAGRHGDTPFPSVVELRAARKPVFLSVVIVYAPAWVVVRGDEQRRAAAQPHEVRDGVAAGDGDRAAATRCGDKIIPRQPRQRRHLVIHGRDRARSAVLPVRRGGRDGGRAGSGERDHTVRHRGDGIVGAVPRDGAVGRVRGRYGGCERHGVVQRQLQRRGRECHARGSHGWGRRIDERVRLDGAGRGVDRVGIHRLACYEIHRLQADVRVVHGHAVALTLGVEPLVAVARLRARVAHGRDMHVAEAAPHVDVRLVLPHAIDGLVSKGRVRVAVEPDDISVVPEHRREAAALRAGFVPDVRGGIVLAGGVSGDVVRVVVQVEEQKAATVPVFLQHGLQPVERAWDEQPLLRLPVFVQADVQILALPERPACAALHRCAERGLRGLQRGTDRAAGGVSTLRVVVAGDRVHRRLAVLVAQRSVAVKLSRTAGVGRVAADDGEVRPAVRPVERARPFHTAGRVRGGAVRADVHVREDGRFVVRRPVAGYGGNGGSVTGKAHARLDGAAPRTDGGGDVRLRLFQRGKRGRNTHASPSSSAARPPNAARSA